MSYFAVSETLGGISVGIRVDIDPAAPALPAELQQFFCATGDTPSPSADRIQQVVLQAMRAQLPQVREVLAAALQDQAFQLLTAQKNAEFERGWGIEQISRDPWATSAVVEGAA